MKVNRCIHCMWEMEEGAAVCPLCGKGQERPSGCYDGLRPNTILHGRYLTGLRVEENTYIAFDLAEGERMSVKEFFPRFRASREGNAVVPSSSPGGEWDKGLEEFLRLGKLLLEPPAGMSLPRVLEVFQENGTAYIALRDPVMPSSGHSVCDLVRDRDPIPKEFEFEHRGIQKIFLRSKSNGVMYYANGVEDVLRPVARNLQWLHQNGFLHRQIKPSEIRWCREDQLVFSWMPLPLLSGEVRGGGHLAGVSAPGHIDPFEPLEEFGQRLPKGPWTDVYSLCAVLYYYVTGLTPPDAISRLDDEQLPGLPADLTRSQRAVLEDGMAVFSKNRIQSIDELLRRVDKSMKGPGRFDPRQNIPQTVYGPPPQKNDEPNICPSCGFQWKSAVMLGKPGCCPHCGEKLPGRSK